MDEQESVRKVDAVEGEKPDAQAFIGQSLRASGAKIDSDDRSTRDASKRADDKKIGNTR